MENDVNAAAGELSTRIRLKRSSASKESNSRFNINFRASTEAQRTAILDDISGLEPPSPDLSHGIAFFRSFRDLVATGFWTSKIGIDDLQFNGNVFVMEWKGCPTEALQKLGLEPQ